MPLKIEIEGSEAKVKSQHSESSFSVGEFVQAVACMQPTGLNKEPMPDCVRWKIDAFNSSIYVVELDPGLRAIRWIKDDSPAPYGSKATYSDRSLATPFVTMVMVVRGGFIAHAEVFFRNQKLKSLESKLFYPTLLNVSPDSYGCKVWMCTQYLETNPAWGINRTLQEVFMHLWGGGFNRSSEKHEGSSSFSLCKEKGIDERVADVNRWEEESKKDPNFVLKVSWLPVGETLKACIDRTIRALGCNYVMNSSSGLGAAVVAHRNMEVLS